jgi:hypothetical protein
VVVLKVVLQVKKFSGELQDLGISQCDVDEVFVDVIMCRLVNISWHFRQAFAGLAVEYAVPWRWGQHASLKVSNSLPVSTAEHCRAEFSSGRILVSHSLFIMGLYFVFLQIHDIIERIKVHHLDPSVDRSIRIVCWIVPPYFKELHCLCKGKKNTNEILEHYF